MNSQTRFPNDAAVLDRALSMFGEDGHGMFLQCSFLNLTSYLFERYKRCQAAVSIANRDINDVVSSCERLDWTRRLAVARQLDPSRWRDYSKADIQFAIIRLRSSLDHVSMVIKALAAHGGSLPNSFHDLVSSLSTRKHRMAPALYEAIDSGRWFLELRKARDEIVHFAANTLVFGEPNEGLIFQISTRRNDALIIEPIAMYNETLAYFDRYAAITLARTYVLLEDLARALGAPPVTAPRDLGQVRSYNPGHPILRGWMQATRSSLDSPAE